MIQEFGCPACRHNFSAEVPRISESLSCPQCGVEWEVVAESYPDGEGGSVLGYELQRPRRCQWCKRPILLCNQICPESPRRGDVLYCAEFTSRARTTTPEKPARHN